MATIGSTPTDLLMRIIKGSVGGEGIMRIIKGKVKRLLIKSHCGHSFVADNTVTHCPKCRAKIGFGSVVMFDGWRTGTTDAEKLARVYTQLKRHDANIYVGALPDCDGGECVIIADWERIRKKLKCRRVRSLLCWIEGLNTESAVIARSQDEYSYCSSCDRPFSTQRQNGSDQGNYVWLVNSGYVCRDCVEDAPEEMIDDYVNQQGRVIKTWAIPLIEAAGFTCLESESADCPIYETGFHAYRADNLTEIVQWVEENLPEHDYLPVLHDMGQFDALWTIFVRHSAVKKGE